MIKLQITITNTQEVQYNIRCGSVYHLNGTLQSWDAWAEFKAQMFDSYEVVIGSTTLIDDGQFTGIKVYSSEAIVTLQED